MKTVKAVNLSLTDKEIKKSTSFKKTLKLDYAKAHTTAIIERDDNYMAYESVEALKKKAQKLATCRAWYALLAAVVAVIAFAHGVWF